MDILEKNQNIGYFDWIIANGVFTEKQLFSDQEMWNYFKLMVTKLFLHTNLGFSFNVMSNIVDWKRDDLFHLSFDKLCQFLSKNITRNFIIRNDYGLYEYTVYIYK
jgi:hypothetical protein